jgi:Protein of unknown function (DUF1441)
VGDVHKIQDSFNWSISRLADCFGICRQTLSKKIKVAGIQAAGMVKGKPVYAIKDVASMVYGPSVQALGNDGYPGQWDSYPEARKAWYQSENERIKFETTTGGLIRESDCAGALAFMAKIFTGSLDSLPDQLEREVGLTPEAAALVQDICDGSRERAYESLLAFGGESDEDS